MAGFREFQTGEVLTASNVDDFLMKQSVQKYADAAARDAALGTAVAGGNALREGMVAWIDADDELQAYDGTAWNPVSGGGLTQLAYEERLTSFTTSSTVFVDVTGMSITVTPSSVDSRFVVFASAPAIASATSFPFFDMRIIRDGAQIGPVGTSRQSGDSRPVNVHVFVTDEPSTVSAVTYKIQMKTSAGSMTVDANTFVVMEVDL